MFFCSGQWHVGHDTCHSSKRNQETDLAKLMHQTLQSSHDLAPHSLRFKGRIKEGSLNTQDRIRWARPNINATLSMVSKRIRFETALIRPLKPVAS